MIFAPLKPRHSVSAYAAADIIADVIAADITAADVASFDITVDADLFVANIYYVAIILNIVKGSVTASDHAQS